jgi:hypothetical protein
MIKDSGGGNELKYDIFDNTVRTSVNATCAPQPTNKKKK